MLPLQPCPSRGTCFHQHSRRATDIAHERIFPRGGAGEEGPCTVALIFLSFLLFFFSFTSFSFSSSVPPSLPAIPSKNYPSFLCCYYFFPIIIDYCLPLVRAFPLSFFHCDFLFISYSKFSLPPSIEPQTRVVNSREAWCFHCGENLMPLPLAYRMGRKKKEVRSG